MLSMKMAKITSLENCTHHILPVNICGFDSRHPWIVANVLKCWKPYNNTLCAITFLISGHTIFYVKFIVATDAI